MGGDDGPHIPTAPIGGMGGIGGMDGGMGMAEHPIMSSPIGMGAGMGMGMPGHI
jgi:hypothetical protein